MMNERKRYNFIMMHFICVFENEIGNELKMRNEK